MALAWLRRALKGANDEETMYSGMTGNAQQQYQQQQQQQYQQRHTELGAGLKSLEEMPVSPTPQDDSSVLKQRDSSCSSSNGDSYAQVRIEQDDEANRAEQKAAATASRIEKLVIARLQRDRQLQSQLSRYFALQKHVLVGPASFDLWVDLLAWRPMFEALAALCKHVASAAKDGTTTIDVLKVVLYLFHAERFALLVSLNDLADLMQEISAEDSSITGSPRSYSSRETGILMQQQQQQQQQQHYLPQPQQQQQHSLQQGTEAAVRGAASSLSHWDKAKFFEIFEAKVMEGEVRGDSVTVSTLESMLSGMEPDIDSSFLAYATFTLFSTFAKTCKSALTLNELAQLVNALDLAVSAQRSPRSVRS